MFSKSIEFLIILKFNQKQKGSDDFCLFLCSVYHFEQSYTIAWQINRSLEYVLHLKAFILHSHNFWIPA